MTPPWFSFVLPSGLIFLPSTSTMDDRSISPIRQLQNLDGEISRFLSSPDSIWSSTMKSAAFLRSIDALLRTISLLPSTSSSSTLDFAEDLLFKSMTRLQREFSCLLSDPITSSSISANDLDDSDLPIPVAQPVKDYNIIIDALPGGIIRDLSEIARRMAAAGYGQECANAYSVSRREFVVESVSRMGVRAFTREEVDSMEFAHLEVEIQRWNQAVKVIFLILFPSERRLSDRVFSELSPIADLGFADACRETAVDFLRFASAVAMGSKAPERLFKAVDMYETFRDLLPEVEVVFGDQYCWYLIEEYDLCCVKLGKMIREIFVEFENLILRDSVKTALPGGGVHPITRYVINYLHAASVAWRTLEEVMEETATPVGDQLRPSSQLSVQIGWIMERLNRNLEEKSRAYPNEVRSYVFLMNNGQYMIEKLSGSELNMMLGEEWFRGQMGRIRQWLAMYQKLSWGKVTATVQVNKDGGMGASTVVKQKLKYFNAYLEEIYREQKGWIVFSERLRDEIRASVVRVVIPAYSSFLERARKEFGRQFDNNVKYSREEVENQIRDLFDVAKKRSSKVNLRDSKLSSIIMSMLLSATAYAAAEVYIH